MTLAKFVAFINWLLFEAAAGVGILFCIWVVVKVIKLAWGGTF